MSNEWSAGYTSEVDYSFGYYAELNPMRVPLALLHAGLRPPTINTACELGFGQGVSLNVHAAAGTANWYGTDFNANQVAFARHLDTQSGAESCLYDDSFDAFTNRADLPEFDYIGLHGVWSWVSDANREILQRFISERLAVGGVLYISYNTLPGWSAFAPVRHLMTQHATSLGSPAAGLIHNIDNAVAFTERLFATSPAFLQANPGATARLEQLKNQDRNYLAHEYFNKDWRPMYFSEVAEFMSSAKLNYAGSASYLDQINNISLTAEQQTLLSEIPPGDLREGTRDLMVNQQFRRDYWVKGKVKLSSLERAELLRDQRIVLCKPVDQIPKSVNGATFNEDVYGPLLARLEDLKVWTLGELETSLTEEGVTLDAITEAALILTNVGAAAPACEESASLAAQDKCDRLNTFLFNQARSAGDTSCLASPVIGGGIYLDRIGQLLVACAKQQSGQPTDWASATWEILSTQGQALVVEGEPLQTAEENLAELTKRAELINDQVLPLLAALRIV